MRQKSIPSIKQATFQAFESMPNEFRGHQLATVVKIITRRRYIYPDSVFRKLRCLKADGKINYRLAAPKDESLYQKVI